jgi:hypothetical protein
MIEHCDGFSSKEGTIDSSAFGKKDRAYKLINAMVN